MTWKSIESDPNDAALRGSRQQSLQTARVLHLIDDRERYLADQCIGKRVLDIGIVAHTPDAYTGDRWLHRYIVEKAAYCLGCDVLGPELKHLESLGYHVVCHDVTSTPLDEKFDVVVLGEVIEHVGRPGDLIQNCARMLSPSGRLFLTTPNPWYITYLLRGLFGKSALVDSVDHVAWYDPATLFELGDRAGLHLDKYTGIRVTKTYTLKARLLFGVIATVGRLVLRPEATAKGIIYEFSKANNPGPSTK